jgi:hypothetical protein
VLGGVALAIFGAPAVPVHAAVRHAVDKTGTSVAASQAEPNFSADYVFVTSCWSGNASPLPPTDPFPRTRRRRSRRATPGTEPGGLSTSIFNGLLHGRRGSESVGTFEVVGVLYASVGRVGAR